MASEAILGPKIKHLCFRAGMVTGFWFSSLVCTHGNKCPSVVSNPLGTTWRSDTRKPVRILLIYHIPSNAGWTCSAVPVMLQLVHLSWMQSWKTGWSNACGVNLRFFLLQVSQKGFASRLEPGLWTATGQQTNLNSELGCHHLRTVCLGKSVSNNLAKPQQYQSWSAHKYHNNILWLNCNTNL